MNQQTIHDILSGEKSSFPWQLLRAALSLAEGPYRAAMRCRRWAYARRLLPSHKAPGSLPVISIGNITTGGSGKTPMVEWLCARLVESGHKPAVLIRGYKGDGRQSDEAMLLQRTLGGGVPIVIGADRVASAKSCVNMNVDTLVMDDGFQHLRLRRNLDIVLIDAINPFGMGRCLPRGLLREDARALRCVHAIVITRSDAVDQESLEALRRRLEHFSPETLICTAVHRPVGVSLAGEVKTLQELKGKRLLAFCGLGNPQGFFHTLKDVGGDVVETISLSDHARYDPPLLEKLCSRARQANATAMITTAKDAVKIDPSSLKLPLIVLEIKMDVTTGRDRLLSLVLSAR